MTDYPPEEFEELADELRTAARGLLTGIIDEKLSVMIVACDLAAGLMRMAGTSSWMDIHTAPTDGTPIIAKRKIGEHDIVGVCSWRKHRLGDDVLADSIYRWRDMASGRHFSPTHWMPIPE